MAPAQFFIALPQVPAVPVVDRPASRRKVQGCVHGDQNGALPPAKLQNLIVRMKDRGPGVPSPEQAGSCRPGRNSGQVESQDEGAE